MRALESAMWWGLALLAALAGVLGGLPGGVGL